MASPDSGHVNLEISENGIAVISFYHPAQNSLPSALLTDLVEKIAGAGQHPESGWLAEYRRQSGSADQLHFRLCYGVRPV